MESTNESAVTALQKFIEAWHSPGDQRHPRNDRMHRQTLSSASPCTAAASFSNIADLWRLPRFITLPLVPIPIVLVE